MFEEFVKKLSHEIKRELPGFSAQKIMAPLGRKPPLEYLKENAVPRKSSVLILLYPQLSPFSIKTVLIVRPENEGGNHAGQISFPGGSADEGDKDLRETALREAEEEIGISRKSVSVLGELSPLYIPISNFMVHPFIGITGIPPDFRIHPAEVQELLEVELDDLFAEKNKRRAEQFIKIRNLKMEVPCYAVKGKLIWGATAMIISEFEEIIRRMN